MKKIITIFAFLALTLGVVATKAQAQMGSMMGVDSSETEVTEENNHAESVEVILQDILDQQSVSTVQQLNFSTISDDDWERLGDAVMEIQHPGQAHEVMDQMMGGEGSESLRQMHINMGKAYLGYADTYAPGMMGGGMMGIMGSGMLGVGPMTHLRQDFGGQVGFGSMMGYGGNGGVYGILGGVTWIALIIFLVAGAYFFIKQAGKK